MAMESSTTLTINTSTMETSIQCLRVRESSSPSADSIFTRANSTTAASRAMAKSAVHRTPLLLMGYSTLNLSLSTGI